MIKMVATDIDGTILPYNGEFRPAVLDCINSLTAKGVKVILVTGRMHSSAVPLAKKLGLDTPVISYQGGLIKEMNGNTLYQSNLPPQTARSLNRESSPQRTANSSLLSCAKRP